MTYKVWHAKEAVVKIQLASSTTITTAAALDTFFTTGSAVAGVMKDITITEPMGDVNPIDLLGTDSNGFQNVELEEKPVGLVEVSGTLILPGDTTTGGVVESFIYGTAVPISSTHGRFRAGLATRRKLAILLNLDDTTDEVNYAGTNMIPTARDTKVTGADGHFETTVTLKGLARDWHGPEFKN